METQLIRSDAFEEMASAYQCIQIDVLNNVLKEHGISDVAIRREICDDFLFQMGEFHDQCWFEAEEERVYPLLCFSTEFLSQSSSEKQLGNVYVPSEMFAFHEYADGNITWYFDDNQENADEIKRGIAEGFAYEDEDDEDDD